jgi:hypothetical protein
MLIILKILRDNFSDLYMLESITYPGLLVLSVNLYGKYPAINEFIEHEL